MKIKGVIKNLKIKNFKKFQVSSVSNFCPDTRDAVVVTFFQARLFSHSLGREEHCKQISLACVGSAHSIWTTLSLPQLMAPLEKAMAPHSSTLACKIPWTEKCGRLQSMGSRLPCPSLSPRACSDLCPLSR